LDDPAGAPVLAPHARLEVRQEALLPELREEGLALRRVVVEVDGRPRLDLVGRVVAADAREGFVAVEDATFGRRAVDAGQVPFEERPKAAFRRPERRHVPEAEDAPDALTPDFLWSGKPLEDPPVLELEHVEALLAARVELLHAGEEPRGIDELLEDVGEEPVV